MVIIAASLFLLGAPEPSAPQATGYFSAPFELVATR
jgi:hypothetical protein